MNISLVNKTLTIVDGNKTYTLREDNLVNLTLKSEYILLETNQVSTPQEIRIYDKFVTVPTHSSLLNLFAIISAWYDVVKNDKLSPREIDGHATRTLSYSEVIDTIIHNVGQNDVNVNLTLPVPIEGYRFRLQCGEPSAHYLRITAPTEKMIVDGVTGQTYAQFSTPVIGRYMDVCTEKVLPNIDGFITLPTLSIGTTDKFEVKNAPFTFVIGGVVVSTGSYETPTGTDVIPTTKWGATAIDINVSGEYSIVSASDNATGYTTSALALAGLATVGSGKLRLGTIAVKKTGGSFTFGTTAFDATNVTVIFTSSTVIVPEYNWVVTNTQSKLVSGTTIKTINGVSLLGSGNIEVQTPMQILYAKTLITADETIFQAVPAGYRLYNLTLENYGTATATVSLGTTVGGSDVINAYSLTVGLHLMESPDILKTIFSLNQETTLYLTALDWTDVQVAISLCLIRVV